MLMSISSSFTWLKESSFVAMSSNWPVFRLWPGSYFDYTKAVLFCLNVRVCAIAMSANLTYIKKMIEPFRKWDSKLRKNEGERFFSRFNNELRTKFFIWNFFCLLFLLVCLWRWAAVFVLLQKNSFEMHTTATYCDVKFLSQFCVRAI